MFTFSYLFANAFHIWGVYLFFEAFFEKAKEKRGRVRILCFVLQYLVVSAEYLLINIPLLTLALNTAFEWTATFFYEANMKRRVIGIVFISAIIVCCESLLITLTGFFPFSMVKKGFYTSEVGMFCYPILPLIIILLYRQLKKNRGDIRLPASYFVSVICVPMSIVYLIFMLLSFREIQAWQIISAVLLLFAMFISVFLLYEKQIKFYSEENKKQILEVQNSYYRKQMEYMISSENMTRSLRHDMKNHLLAISALAKKDGDLPVEEYIDTLYHYSQLLTGNAPSGNVVIDSILNGKRALASEKGIALKMDIAIPEELAIRDVDMTVLLGNLLDNAIENFDNKSEGAVELGMWFDRGRLFIRLVNPYVHEEKNNKFYNIKGDKKNHGFGLQNIRNAVNQYNGEIKIENKEGIFLVEILLYLPEAS